MLVLLLVIVMAGMETAGVVSIVPFLMAITQPDLIESNHVFARIYDLFGFSSRQNFIVALGAASAAVIVFSSALKTITQHVLNRFSHLQLHSISTRLLRNYLQQPYAFFLEHNTADLTKNLLSETDQAIINLIQPVAHSIAQAIVVLAMALLLFFYDPRIALGALLAMSALYGSVYLLVRNRLARIGIDRIHANRERHQSSSEALAGIKDVKLSGATEIYIVRFSQAVRRFARHRAASDTMAQTPLFLVEATGYCGLILIAIILLLRGGDASHALPALGLYGFAAYRMLPAFQIIYRGISRMRFSGPALAKLHAELHLQPESTVTAHQAPLVPHKEIRLEHVSFHYPRRPDAPVLQDFSLTIPVHTSVAIVGRSGSGKSTLMDILLGLLQPQKGTLYIDGTPITPDNVGAWQRAIGYVPQHIYLADVSVAENIAFGVPAENIDHAAVERAAKAAQIHDFIVNEMERGYQTPIGDRGIRLSGGQRQRLGIARALYKDPPVLFMDEATSALDEHTEAALAHAIQTLVTRKTIIIIGHRRISIDFCEKILSL